MKNILFTFIALMLSTVAMAQMPEYERTNDITLFHEYQPATITLTSGNLNHQRQANIFLKGSTFIYRQGKNVMEANMSVIKSVKFGDRVFVNVGSRLAEVVYTYGNAQMLRVKTINAEDVKNEMLNSSTITDLSMTSDQMGITRIMESEDQLLYPLTTEYYFYIYGKYVFCHERDMKRAAGKKHMETFERITKGYNFRWSSADCLQELLKALEDDAK